MIKLDKNIIKNLKKMPFFSKLFRFLNIDLLKTLKHLLKNGVTNLDDQLG